MMNSLGLNKKPEDTRVVVAMSGGVDSSVAAAMLAGQGYETIGITLQLYDHSGAVKSEKACCAGQDIYDAKRVAEKIGIKHYVLNYESHFKQSVMDDFADSYLRGETPIPCVRCNEKVKFQDLLNTARDLEADVMATGHYVRRKGGATGGQLWRGEDMTKDQSYFLFTTTQEQLDFLRFPLGDMTKDETREIAIEHGLPVASKPDSQDICFVPNGDYASVISKLRPGAIDAGKIVHIDGRELGNHDGIINYTIGQRRGLGLGGAETGGEPLYVVALDPDDHRVIVGPREALGRDRIYIIETNWLIDLAIGDRLDCRVKLRSTTPAKGAVIERTGVDTAVIHLNEAQYGIAAGQAGVCYLDDRMIGGGWITGSDHSKYGDPIASERNHGDFEMATA
jgi:tRNA-specific 2-thiouridylase